ncbi:MAG: TRAP transporter substrate-binding protein [Rhodospirillaceae bacterium]
MKKTAPLTIAAVGIFVAVSVQPGAAETTIRAASFTAPQATTISVVMQPWMDAVEKDVGAEVGFQAFWGGALGRNPVQQYELLVNGIADVAFIVPSYTLAQFPEMSVFSLPYLFRSGDEASTAAWRMYEKGILTGFDKVHPVTIYASDNNALHLSKPIRTLEEVKGMKIRTAGPQESDLIRLFGATPVGMGMPTVTESISRGVIDGTLQSWTGVRSFRVANVTKGHVEEPLGTLSFVIGMNKDAYMKLPQAVRESMDRHGGLGMAKRGGVGFDTTSEAYSAELKKDASRSFIAVEGAEAEKREAMFLPLHDEWKKSVADGAKKYKALTQILEDIRAGR